MTLARSQDFILSINGGSSTIKFSLYRHGVSMRRTFRPRRLAGGRLTSQDPLLQRQGSVVIDATNIGSVAICPIDWLARQVDFSRLKAIGHRVVHGMRYATHQIVSPPLLKELRGHCALDTVFHRTMARVASILPLPHRFGEKGVQRYGFHGLSYDYLLERLALMDEFKQKQGRIVLAHLGSGASMAAIRNAVSIDTGIGFSPAGGLVMGTRSGDLDPGVACYLMQTENLTGDQLSSLINRESGRSAFPESARICAI